MLRWSKVDFENSLIVVGASKTAGRDRTYHPDERRAEGGAGASRIEVCALARADQAGLVCLSGIEAAQAG
jgi:hypothetical protein